LSDFLAAAGLLFAAAGGAAAILLPAGRARSVAMVVALVLFPVLILGDQWHSRQIVDLRDDTARLVVLAVGAVAVSVALALVFRRWPVLLPLAIVAALPFRIPLHAGGDTANLLVPLYLVIAGGVLSAAASSTRPSHPSPPTGPARLALDWLPKLLAGVVLLYAIQSLYSLDFSKGLQDVCFFYVPFALVYALLRDVRWDRGLLVLILWVVGIESVAFVLVGTVEYLTRDLFWNDQVIRSNEFHTYFRVNSVFWDPNIYGRYLALVIVVVTAALLWARERMTLALLTGLIAVLWVGLAPTFSQSSFIALLAGLAILAALRWSWRWTLAAVVVGGIAAVLVVTLVGGKEVTTDRLNVDTSGRGNLISGGAHLFAQRPVYGYGSGSFPRAYREHVRTSKVPVSVSHTEPITIAAEQGILGLLLYVSLIVCGLAVMGSGMFSRPPPVARAAVLAAFVALLVHTMAYAGFYEDPITWVLLAAAVGLGRESLPRAPETAPGERGPGRSRPAAQG
jgi:putative inorganic carbon (HCO3(-)) transporter